MRTKKQPKPKPKLVKNKRQRASRRPIDEPIQTMLADPEIADVAAAIVLGIETTVLRNGRRAHALADLRAAAAEAVGAVVRFIEAVPEDRRWFDVSGRHEQVLGYAHGLLRELSGSHWRIHVEPVIGGGADPVGTAYAGTRNKGNEDMIAAVLYPKDAAEAALPGSTKRTGLLEAVRARRAEYKRQAAKRRR